MLPPKLSITRRVPSASNAGNHPSQSHTIDRRPRKQVSHGKAQLIRVMPIFIHTRTAGKVVPRRNRKVDAGSPFFYKTGDEVVECQPAMEGVRGGEINPVAEQRARIRRRRDREKRDREPRGREDDVRRGAFAKWLKWVESIGNVQVDFLLFPPRPEAAIFVTSRTWLVVMANREKPFDFREEREGKIIRLMKRKRQ